MARTAGDVLSSADFTLSDAARVRYTAPERLGFVVDGLQAIKNLRPDVFVGQFGTALATTLTTGTTLPLDDQFFRPLVDYVIARCETKDDEYVVGGRVDLMAKAMEGFLT